MRNTIMIVILTTALAAASGAIQLPQAAQTAPAQSQPAAVMSASQRMRDEATAMRGLINTPLGRAFLDGAANLPTIAPRTIYRNPTTRDWLSADGAKTFLAAHPDVKLQETAVDENRYYDTKYGTPVAYARLFDILGSTTGLREVAGLKVLDFGYGTIGHLRMLASCGANVTGLDVDTFLTALYSEPTDTGTIHNPPGPDGSITLVDGRFSDAAVRQKVGGEYDLIISKNTLKRGYIHPPADAHPDPRTLVDLGVDDETFLQTIFAALKPGGWVMIYNLCPKQADLAKGEKFIPWADGRCPFESAAIEKAGFRVLALDREDNTTAREMAHVLGWDQGDGAMDLQNDLFAHFTLLEKPRR